MPGFSIRLPYLRLTDFLSRRYETVKEKQKYRPDKLHYHQFHENRFWSNAKIM